jgi:hypothetical protein
MAALLIGTSAPAHDGSHEQCYLSPPPPNSEGPPEDEGYWEDVVDIGIQAIHSIHLPLSGKLLIWGYNHGQRTSAPGIILDPESGAIENIMVGSPAFCAGHSHLPDGRIFISGGRNSRGIGTVFDPFLETWSPVQLYGERFYPTHTSLSDGRVFISGGTGRRSGNPEIFDPVTNTTTPVACTQLPNGFRCGSASLRMHWYPRMALGEDDNLLFLPANRPLYAATFDAANNAWVSHENGGDPRGRWIPAPTVYYAEGRALKAGADSYGSHNKATTNASVVEFDDIFNPTERAVAPMEYARNRNTLTLLADGKVLATGGRRDAPCAEGDPNVYNAELWDPATETWETLGAMQNTRVYHSTAILLRDGSVFSAGGEPKQHTSQIFRPPYLFHGPRPVISSAPAEIDYATSFEVLTPDAASVQAVNLLRLGAVTHAYDQSQRFVPLTFTAQVDRVVVDGPEEPYDAPAGYYMLFLISDQGVPSIAEYVRVRESIWW